jgi:hypothetical protein
MGWGVVQVVETLPNMQEALGLISSTAKKKKKKERKK